MRERDHAFILGYLETKYRDLFCGCVQVDGAEEISLMKGGNRETPCFDSLVNW